MEKLIFFTEGFSYDNIFCFSIQDGLFSPLNYIVQRVISFLT